jgi:protein-S-isoprenylcysteine O-methyltransferase Ste14
MPIAIQDRPSDPEISTKLPSFARRAIALLYGATAYAIFLGTFIYAIGFVSQYLVPKTIDSGATTSPWRALSIDLLLLSMFAVQHSGMARQGFKRLFARFASPVVERSSYVLSASLTLLLLFWQWRPIPAVIWDIQNPIPASLAIGGGFLGWLIVLYSTFLISHFELFGLTQVITHFAGRITAPALVTTAYIFVGIYLEERDLMSFFGDEYRRYRNRVAMLLPGVF